MLWFGCLCIRHKNKQSRRSRLLKFRLEQRKHFLVFFLLVVYVVGHCNVFLLNDRRFLFACTVKYIENGIYISVSIAVRSHVYLAKKQAVKVKKSTEVSA